MNNYNHKKNILVIQTAFIGDTILASSFVHEVKKRFPDCRIHFLLRDGNQSVIEGLPDVYRVWVWKKHGGKIRNLLRIIYELLNYDFECVFNLHRHFSSGFVTMLLDSKHKVGFKQNPLSFFYSKKINHQIPHVVNGVARHEVQRNLELLQAVEPDYVISENPKEYPPHLPLDRANFAKIPQVVSPYVVIAPSSVWFTKQWEENKFKELVASIPKDHQIYLVGGKDDFDLCERIKDEHKNVYNVCGKFGLLESALLMKEAKRVIVNDSSPMHLASAMNANTTAVFCSTIPEFGYFPLAQNSTVVQVKTNLDCRPCGLHGKKSCPKLHYNCSGQISVQEVLKTID